MVSLFLHWNEPLSGNDAFPLTSFSSQWQYTCSRWGEETVEIEREGVELLISAVPLKCPKFNPPWHSPVSCTILVVECVVQKDCNNQCNSRGWEEDSVQEIIELHIKETTKFMSMVLVGSKHVHVCIHVHKHSKQISYIQALGNFYCTVMVFCCGFFGLITHFLL